MLAIRDDRSRILILAKLPKADLWGIYHYQGPYPKEWVWLKSDVLPEIQPTPQMASRTVPEIVGKMPPDASIKDVFDILLTKDPSGLLELLAKVFIGQTFEYCHASYSLPETGPVPERFEDCVWRFFAWGRRKRRDDEHVVSEQRPPRRDFPPPAPSFNRRAPQEPGPPPSTRRASPPQPLRRPQHGNERAPAQKGRHEYPPRQGPHRPPSSRHESAIR